MSFKIYIICLGLLIASSSTAQQNTEAPRVTGFFSDMRYIPEAGDVLGTEVWIVYARGAYYASVQLASGEPEPPYVVPVNVGASQVAFSIREPIFDQDGKPAPDEVIEFQGTVSKAGLMLTKPSHVLLKRQASYWQ